MQAQLSHWQAASSHTRRWEGHGLGLRRVGAMLQLLECPPLELTASGETVTASLTIPYHPHEVGKGTTVDDEGTTGAEQGSPAAAIHVPRPALRSVLVVDDEEFIRAITVMSLQVRFKM